VEDQANRYFQQIYTSQQSIPEIVEMLRRFRTSEVQLERDIFACMVQNLFDEYRFFFKYPEKELRITGVLFGTLIMNQLVQSTSLGIALRYGGLCRRLPRRVRARVCVWCWGWGWGWGYCCVCVSASFMCSTVVLCVTGRVTMALFHVSAVGVYRSYVMEALKKVPNNPSNVNMFRFGMYALEQFKTRLPKWPQYCAHILQIPHLREHYPALIAEISSYLQVGRLACGPYRARLCVYTYSLPFSCLFRRSCSVRWCRRRV
jgi:hypothetical protein